MEAYFLTSVVFTPQVLQSQLTGPGHWDGLRCPPLHPWDIRSQSRATSSADRDTVSDLTPPVDKNGLPGLGESTVKPGLPGCSLTHQAFIEKPQDGIMFGKWGFRSLHAQSLEDLCES